MRNNRGAITYVVSTLFQQLVAVGLSIFAARLIGASEYGALSVSRNFFVIGLILAPLGIDIAVLRFTRSTDSKFEGINLAHLRAIVGALNSLFVVAIAVGGGTLIDRIGYRIENLSTLLLLAVAALPFAADTAIMTQAFRARGEVVKPTLVSFVAQPLVRALVAIPLLLLHFGASAILIGTIAGYGVSAIVLSVMHGRVDIPLRAGEWSLGSIRRSASIFRISLWFAASTFVYSVLRNVDVLILGLYVSTRTVGSYAALTMFAQTIQIVPQALSQTLGPQIARAYEAQDFARMKSEINGYLRMASITTAPIAVGIAAFGPYLNLVFGKTFHFDQAISINMAVGYYIAAILAPLGFALSMTGRHRSETTLLVGGTTIVVLLGLVMAKQFGANGIALAVTTGFIMINLGRTVIVTRTFRFIVGATSDFLPPLAAVAVATVVVLLMAAYSAVNVVTLFAAAGLYLVATALLYWVIILSPAERHALRKALFRSKVLVAT